MKFFILALAIFSLSSHALNLKPGLWKIDMTIKENGKVIDPMAELKSAMKDMPEEQKKQMMQAMEGSGMDAGKDITQCYTKEMIKKAELGTKDEEGCESKVVKKTASKIVTKFKCEDGTTGDAIIDIKSPKSYVGLMNMTDSNGEKAQLTYKANFVSSDCGNVKPLGV